MPKSFISAPKSAMLPPPVSVEIGSQRIDATTSIVTPNSRLTGSNCAFLNNTMSVNSTSMMRIMFSSVSSIPSAGIALMQPGLIRIKKQNEIKFGFLKYLIFPLLPYLSGKGLSVFQLPDGCHSRGFESPQACSPAGWYPPPASHLPTAARLPLAADR